MTSVVVVAAAGCLSASPRDVLEAYSDAVERGDAAAIARLQTSRRPAMSDPERIAAFREAHPELWAKVQKGLDSEPVAVNRSTEIELESGMNVRLIKRDGRWRIDGDRIWAYGAASPEMALRTLAAGIDAGDLAAVRSVIPETKRAAFASDVALMNHIEEIRGRVSAAMGRIGAVRPGMAEIRGDRASITYGDRRQVRFVWEAKRWRVLDVE